MCQNAYPLSVLPIKKLGPEPGSPLYDSAQPLWCLGNPTSLLLWGPQMLFPWRSSPPRWFTSSLNSLEITEDLSLAPILFILESKFWDAGRRQTRTKPLSPTLGKEEASPAGPWLLHQSCSRVRPPAPAARAPPCVSEATVVSALRDIRQGPNVSRWSHLLRLGCPNPTATASHEPWSSTPSLPLYHALCTPRAGCSAMSAGVEVQHPSQWGGLGMTFPSKVFSFRFFNGLLTQILMGNDSKTKFYIYINYFM